MIMNIIWKRNNLAWTKLLFVTYQIQWQMHQIILIYVITKVNRVYPKYHENDLCIVVFSYVVLAEIPTHFKVFIYRNWASIITAINDSHSASKTTLENIGRYTVYPKKYAHGFVVLCFVVVMQSFIINSHEVFIHIHQGCFAGTGAIVRLPECQWNKPDGYGKISQCIITTKHSKAKTVCIFLGIYFISFQCTNNWYVTKTKQNHAHPWWDISAVHDWMLSCFHNGVMFTGKKAVLYWNELRSL